MVVGLFDSLRQFTKQLGKLVNTVGDRLYLCCTGLYCTVLYCTVPVWSSWCQTMLKMLTVMRGTRMRAAVQLTQAPRPASPRSLASHTTTAVSSP